MSFWRPSELNCIYVIGDVHGRFEELQLIFNRILPLRKSDGGKDTLVMLGDYIDRRIDSHKVLDLLIDVQEEQPDQVVLLRGNHEQMLLWALKQSSNPSNYLLWMDAGSGYITYKGYLQRAGADKEYIENPYLLPRTRLKDFIPNEHVNFLNNLKYYYETEEYIFLHAGCDPRIPLAEQEKEEFLWDNGLFKFMMNNDALWTKTMVTGHSGQKNGKPIIKPGYMMLDTSYGSGLLVRELRSGEMFEARPGNTRLVKIS